MRAARLRSSLIERILWDEERAELTITFTSRDRYIYSGVPRAIYEALKTARSAGAFFNQCVKGRFPCRPDPTRKKFRPA